MDGWTRTLKAIAMAPAVAVSTAVWLMLAAILPTGAGGLLLLSTPAVLAVLWVVTSGRVGRLVDRAGVLLAGAREPTDDELAALRPVIKRLIELQVDEIQLLVSRSARRYPPMRPFGRDQVVVSPVLIGAVLRRQLSVDEAVALLTHDVGWLRAQPTRGAVAIAAWTLPWRVLSAVAWRFGTAARRVPLVGFAWRLRLVVGAVAVIQSAVEGRVPSAIVVATLVMVAYVTPAARRADDARLQAAADRYVVEHRLGPTLLGAMNWVGASRPDASRIRRLQAGVHAEALTGSAPEPVLRLVPS